VRAALDAPGIGVGTIVLEGDRTVGFEGIDLRDAMAAAMTARTAGVYAGTVLLDRERVVGLLVLGGNSPEEGPPGVAVESVAARPGRNAPIEDLEGLEPVAIGVDAGVDEVGRGAVATGDREALDKFREGRLQHVELTCHQRQAIAKRGRELRLDDGSLREIDLEEVVVAVVEGQQRVEGHNEKDPGKHLEHLLVQQEVDRARDLVVGSRPIEIDGIALAVDLEVECNRAVAHPVVVDVVLERVALALGDELTDQVDHPLASAIEDRRTALLVGLPAEAIT